MRRPGSTCVVKGNELTATGTDLDLTVRSVIEVIGIDDGEAVVPARLVADAVRHLEPGAVTIDANDEKVEISAARSKYSLRTFPAADFPSLPTPGRASTSVPASELVESLRQVVRASSSDDARPLLTGVLFTNDGRNAATGGDRLVSPRAVRPAGPHGDRRGPDLLVPSRALTELQRICASMPEDAEVGVGAVGHRGHLHRRRRPRSARGSSTARTRTTASSSRRATRTGCTSARSRCSRRCAARASS